MSDIAPHRTTPVPRDGAFAFRDLHLAALSLPVIVVAMFIFLAVTKEAFLGYSNLYSIVFALSIDAIAIIGFTYVMVMGEIDLSVGAVYAFAGIMTGWLMKFGFGLWPAIGMALALALMIGFINGYLVTRFKINSLMLTIGTMIFVQGIVGVLTTMLVGGTYPRDFRMLAKTRLFDINVTILAVIVIVLLLQFLERRASFFRKLYLVGENPETAIVYGIRSARIKIGIFMLSAFTAGIAGILTASRLTHADTQMGLGLEFTLVTAAVLGGASLYGGRGNVATSILGLFFLALILNGLILYGVEPVLQQFVVGFLLVSAVLLDRLFNRHRGTR